MKVQNNSSNASSKFLTPTTRVPKSFSKPLRFDAGRINFETLREIADFVYFIRRRAADPKSFEDEQFHALVGEDLSSLSESELEHLDEEFADYESVYPRR